MIICTTQVLSTCSFLSVVFFLAKKLQVTFRQPSFKLLKSGLRTTATTEAAPNIQVLISRDACPRGLHNLTS